MVRGYEKETDLKSDSPTVHKESLRIFLAITSTFNYDIHSIGIFDVYASFTREEYRQGYIYKTTGGVYIRHTSGLEAEQMCIWSG